MNVVTNAAPQMAITRDAPNTAALTLTSPANNAPIGNQLTAVLGHMIPEKADDKALAQAMIPPAESGPTEFHALKLM